VNVSSIKRCTIKTIYNNDVNNLNIIILRICILKTETKFLFRKISILIRVKNKMRQAKCILKLVLKKNKQRSKLQGNIDKHGNYFLINNIYNLDGKTNK
jgi:filamentous hemagglutinin family protein